MKKIGFFVGGVVIFSLTTGFLVTPASALVIRESIEELSYEADLVVTGKVKDMKSRWNTDRTLIHTYVTVSVTEYIKRNPEGEGPTEITVKVLGGEVGDIGLKVSDTPEFTEGEEVFLFLRMEELPIFRVAGLFQGKYTIEDGKAKNKVLKQEIPLDSLIGRIREIMEGPGLGR